MSTFKRIQAGVESATFYYKFAFEGKQLLRKTPFTNRKDAEKAEADHRFLLESGKFDEANKIRSRKATADTTLAQIETVYLTAPVDASAKTRKHNVNAWKNLFRTARGVAYDATLPASIINGELARVFFNKASAEVLGESNQTAQCSTRRSANSIMRQAKSLFATRALDAYAEAGLSLPNVGEFMKAAKAKCFTKAVKTDYHAPPQTLITTTLLAWEKMENREMFLAVGHALAFGLRKSEIHQCRWNWHAMQDNIPCLDASGDMKNQTGFLQVRALDPFYTIMMKIVHERGWLGKPGDYIISGTHTFRTDELFRNIAAWLRASGWETQKATHEFRAYAGSQVAMRYNIYDAMTWLRHSSVKVTEQAYLRYVKLFRPSDPTKLAARWAEGTANQTTREFVPAVLPQATIG